VKPVSVTFSGDSWRENLSGNVLGAWGGAIEEAQKAAQREFASMQKDIQKEMS
jgi:hypothetical protein